MDILPPTHTAMGQSAAWLSAQGLYSLPCRQDQLQLLCTGNFMDHTLQTFIEASWHCRRYHSHFSTGVQMPSLLHVYTYNVHARTVSARQGPNICLWSWWGVVGQKESLSSSANGFGTLYNGFFPSIVQFHHPLIYESSIKWCTGYIVHVKECHHMYMHRNHNYLEPVSCCWSENELVSRSSLTCLHWYGRF